MNRGYLTGRNHKRGPMPRRGRCPNCDKRGLTTWKPNTFGIVPMLTRYCQYCGHAESRATTSFYEDKHDQKKTPD